MYSIQPAGSQGHRSELLAPTFAAKGPSGCVHLRFREPTNKAAFPEKKQDEYTYKYDKKTGFMIPLTSPMAPLSSDIGDSDTLPSSPASSICRCENQLSHYNWDGIWHSDLPRKCRPIGWRTPEPSADNHPVTNIAEGDGRPLTVWSSGSD